MDKEKMVLLISAAIMEIAALIIIVKAIATDSSLAQGLIFLAIGLFFLVIGIRKKPKDAKTDG